MKRLRGLFSRFRSDTGGAAAIEFALLTAPYFLIIFMILETAFVFIGDMTLDQAAARAGRTVRTGEVANSNRSEAEFKSALCNELVFLLDCDSVRIDLRAYSTFAGIPTEAPVVGGQLQTANFTYERGNAGQVMALRVFYEYPLYTTIVHRFLSDLEGGKHLMMAVSIFRTEPF